MFGDCVDVYDIAQAVQDGAAVPIYVETRAARIEMDAEAAALLDEDFFEAIEGLQEDTATSLLRKWSQVEALVGADQRLDAVVADILRHFDARAQAMAAKAMAVCMSRRICAEVYKRIVALDPEWHGELDGIGAVKVVMTGSATAPGELQAHIRSKSRQEAVHNLPAYFRCC